MKKRKNPEEDALRRSGRRDAVDGESRMAWISLRHGINLVWRIH